jgi:Ulp1 protease family, C-terminal catalytic domain
MPLPLQVGNIPHQDNYHDCGLYTLTYLEFFAFKPPKAIHKIPRGGLAFWWGPDSNAGNPAFLTARWFPHENGSNLRQHLKCVLIAKLVTKALTKLDSEDGHKENGEAREHHLTCLLKLQEENLLEDLPEAERCAASGNTAQPESLRNACCARRPGMRGR